MIGSLVGVKDHEDKTELKYEVCPFYMCGAPWQINYFTMMRRHYVTMRSKCHMLLMSLLKQIYLQIDRSRNQLLLLGRNQLLQKCFGLTRSTMYFAFCHHVFLY
ncbi:hypothetical protein SETIT_3G211400v2 [Setaria italica]|uniref:Uncharacterized protein n=1 Tax=Setaria italica TaxID=4555 RepID=A0A368QHV5_SETIT|nr:hypothetical protein SETIT_3G211400v2 [Setaria italica]